MKDYRPAGRLVDDGVPRNEKAAAKEKRTLADVIAGASRKNSKEADKYTGYNPGWVTLDGAPVPTYSDGGILPRNHDYEVHKLRKEITELRKEITELEVTLEHRNMKLRKADLLNEELKHALTKKMSEAETLKKRVEQLELLKDPDIGSW